MQVSLLFLILFFDIHLAAFAAIDQNSRLVTMGNQSPEPVDETMSGNQFHIRTKNYKNEATTNH